MGDIIYEIILPKEVVFKEEDGEGSAPALRHGRIDTEMLYTNRQVINTRNGRLAFNPRVVIYFKAFTDLDSVLIIDIFDNDTKNLIKKFNIKSTNNNFTINDMKSIVDDIKSLLDGDGENKIVSLIELIRNKENLKFEEVAQ